MPGSSVHCALSTQILFCSCFPRRIQSISHKTLFVYQCPACLCSSYPGSFHMRSTLLQPRQLLSRQRDRRGQWHRDCSQAVCRLTDHRELGVRSAGRVPGPASTVESTRHDCYGPDVLSKRFLESHTRDRVNLGRKIRYIRCRWCQPPVCNVNDSQWPDVPIHGDCVGLSGL
jgi:hypothetical protein